MPDKKLTLIKNSLLTNPDFVDISKQIIKKAYTNGLITKKDKLELMQELNK